MLGQSALRSGCQWFKLQISGDGLSLTMADNNRVYDGSFSYPYFYYMPSLMVNSAGDMVMGFSGSTGTEYIGAFYTGRLANGTTVDKPVLLQAGRSFYGNTYWGDYCYTSLDPDGLTFWTVQEYAGSPDPSSPQTWGTWICKIKH